MKAEEYLKSKGLKNPPLDSGISGGGDAPRKRVSDVMKTYAKDQIEKDRERVEENVVYFYGSADIEATHNKTPIILD